VLEGLHRGTVEVVKIMPTLALPRQLLLHFVVKILKFLLPKALVLAVLLILTCMNLTRSLILTSAVMLSLILLGEVFLFEVKR